ncbi:TadE/TadG family type IV pilus assembly protein [Erythrobacter aurantius]|uniref:TadE/TadG family type IV pilus assembly protein n=1 Tax=Erythrobacter aurantius TaxID=2909249 RepID=UPI00207B0DCA|nr:TadE/TadG family type IV pilus assembly protein [Erythrobacter aurantius]
MRKTSRYLASLVADGSGTMVVEFALVAPVMALLLIGTVEVGFIVARQHELQSAASEVEAIVMATNQGAETDPDELEEILMESVNLTGEDVSIVRKYRCGISSELVNSSSSCFEGDVVSSYLEIAISDTRLPIWSTFGIGQEIRYSVERTVQIS